jgi:arylformamidase
MTHSAWYEREYNPRVTVSDAASFGPRWTAQSEASRHHFADILRQDLRYGHHPRESFDLFVAPRARGALIFFHGGYWRAFSKDVFSFVADHFIPRGISVAVVNYPLCPEKNVADIVQSARKSVAEIWKNHLSEHERAQLIVAGHSAGGYLTAALWATAWPEFGLLVSPFQAGLPISGVFDVAPLVHTSINEQVQLDLQQARALNLFDQLPQVGSRLLPIYGALESNAFRRQSEDLAETWPMVEPALGIAGRHHFDIVDGLSDPASPVFQAAYGLFEPQ